ncbi:alpha/beta hydrolase [Clostridium sp. D2Q-11]|uniref:Alpha/beta hydrolase n=1 Tax=Anaeromonas frigoriresistens TaxID=2683708 RepID=A0A942Z9J3_9FIRM|nr:alpha/beta hydrolase [Anaeromonas frigoriresistens]
MKTILFKGILNGFDLIGRKFYYNNDLPKDVYSVRNREYSFKSKYNKLDIHFPEGNTEKLPIMIYIHGGGWTIGNKGNYTKLCQTIANEGFLVFNINYRLGPKNQHPSQVIDVIDAIKWVKENYTDYNGDINQIFLGGDSGGAHLSSLVSCILTNENLRKSYNIETPIVKEQLLGLILYYGAYNFDTLIDTGFPAIKIMVKSYIGTKKPEESQYIDQISPIDHITKDFPPVFITAGKVDWLYSQTAEMIEELDRKGIQYSKLIFDKTTKEAQHAFINFYKRDCTKEAYNATIEFLKENIKHSVKI